MKRPIIWVVGILFFFFVVTQVCYGEKQEEIFYSMDQVIQKKTQAKVVGRLHHIENKPNSSYFYLKKVSVTLSGTNQCYYFSDFLAIQTQNQKISFYPGNLLQISGSVESFCSPTNPGQFNEKSYYKEKNIYYKIIGDSWEVTDTSTNPCLTLLYQTKEALKQVYENCLPKKEAGIVTAMLLGDKSTLDMDVRELYQTNGIGHLLAISGLHISILCMALYGGLRYCPLPKTVPFLITVLFLLAYGIMTGFSISTSRAVIMMILFLLAKEWGRSYDPITAMGLSAVIIWLQKPCAIFSSSFLLSYGAMAGVCLVLPAIKVFFQGTWQEQQAKSRKKRRSQRELAENSSFGKIYLFFHRKKEQLISSICCSLAIWFATVPILCYFFYEFPTYGILLNLFVLPLASVLVITSMLGGIAGLFFLPAGKGILCIARGILFFYEKICQFFQNLPEPIQITGCPEPGKIFLYYGILWILCFILLKRLYHQERFLTYSRSIICCCFLAGLMILFSPKTIRGFSCIIMDVGQGDGILLRTEQGKTILVDGGSTSISQVGKYRIIPCLKYYGIRKIDYMIMTHEDEDHVSGQRELLEAGKETGISIGCYLLPEPDSSSTGDNYHQMEQLAKAAQVSQRKIHRGDRILLGQLCVTCLHPEKGFVADSANAYSTTLSVTYKNRSILLTGDLEKNGEETLMASLGNYDILKVAHHGSKNSTPEEFLKIIRPYAAIISCGKNNRYGHPHGELIERLSLNTPNIYRTDERGAILLQTRGKEWRIRTYES